MARVENAQMPDGGAGLAVIKVGGSLLGWPELPSRLEAWLENDERDVRSPRRRILIAGGGALADVIRSMDQVHGLGEGRSHDLAIRAMDVTAALLAALLPGTRLVSGREEIEAAWWERATPVLAPRSFLEEAESRSPDPLPASWDVTSDSIAARVAWHLGAARLVLLKSARMGNETSLDGLVRAGLVDPLFPMAAASLPRVELVGMRDSPPTSLRLDRGT